MIVVHDERGSRHHRAFPLSIGGPGAEIALPDTEQVLGWLGQDQDRVFVQVADDARLSIDGRELEGSRWLSGGECLTSEHARIRVRAEEDGLHFTAEARDAREVVLTPPADTSEPGEPITPVAFAPEPIQKKSKNGGFPWRTTAVLLPLLVLTLAAAYIFTAVPVDLRIAPTPERFTLSGGLTPIIGGRYLLLPGQYTVRAQKAGYHDLVAEVGVDRSSRELRFALEKLPGLLHITTVDGAEVRIDGAPMGSAPLEPLSLREGSHEIEIRAPRHRPFSTVLEIAGEGRVQTLSAPLEPLWASVRFTSKPSGATVRVDDTVLGQTPLRVDLDEGRRRLVVTRKGYKPLRGQFDVTAQQPLIVPELNLEPSDGNLTLDSRPSGATVMIDDRFRGTTPLDLALAPGRTYDLVLGKAGYLATAEQIELTPGQTEDRTIELRPETGTVALTVFPPDAEILVDGDAVTDTRLVLQTLPHQLEVRKPGYTVWKREVTPLADIEKAITVELKTVAQARIDAIREVYSDSQGHELRLIRPPQRAFEMGASRREPGRRANEVLREVRLTRPYYLGAREVTNGQLKAFLGNHAPQPVGSLSLGDPLQPATRITWEDAAAYCNWLSAQEGLPAFYEKKGETYVPVAPVNHGYRLPTEAEWAYAARYEGGREEPLKYPWGDALPVAEKSGNFADKRAATVLAGTLGSYDDGFAGPAPPASFAANGFGLYDMGGNVAEWVHDYYGTMGPPGEDVDPFGMEDGTFRVIRGSGWMHSTITELRLSFRDYGNKARPDVGFRVARYLE